MVIRHKNVTHNNIDDDNNTSVRLPVSSLMTAVKKNTQKKPHRARDDTISVQAFPRRLLSPCIKTTPSYPLRQRSHAFSPTLKTSRSGRTQSPPFIKCHLPNFPPLIPSLNSAPPPLITAAPPSAN